MLVIATELICIHLYKFNKNGCILILACFICIIISYFIVSNNEIKYNTIRSEISGEKYFSGIVTEVGKETEYYRTYKIKIESINNDSKYKNINVLLRVKKASKSNSLKYGDRINGKGNFERPSVKRNYKGFDYSEYLKTKSVYMICVVDYNNIEIVKNNSLFMYDMCINNLKSRIKNNMLKILPKESANISIALLLGDTFMLDSDQKELFSEASLSHILAISGMHVSYVIIGVDFLLKRFDKRKGKYFFIIILFFFSHFTGGSASVVRAVIMAIIAIFSKLIYRKSDTLNNIGIAALIILILNPYSIMNLGFQLSFFGTLGIVLLNTKISSMLKFIKYKKINSLLSVSISANIMIFPILINTYNTISFVFLISNILVAPLLGVMCFTGYLTIIISLISINMSKACAIILNVILKIFSVIAYISGNLEFLKFTVRTPNIIIIVVYYLIIFYMFFYYKKNHKKMLIKIFSSIIIIILIFKLIFSVIFNYKAKLRIYFVDVGQGDCTVIVTPTNKTIIIDGGGNEGREYDIGKNVLIPYLLDRGICSIDYIIFSHFDSDHAKGLLSIMEKMKVKNAIVSKQGKDSDNYSCFLKLAEKKKIKVIYMHLGEIIKVDKYIYLDFLWPCEELINENVLNNNSIVCKLHYGKFTMLFTGDIEKIAEDMILQKYNEKQEYLSANVLKVGHHGSKTSSSSNFINAINPEVALIGVGENNKFGHPNEDVIERFEMIRYKNL